jgi:uncharacterized protein (DUF486 family)
VPVFLTTLQVPNVSQLKILQEVITLWVFVPFAVVYRRQPLKLDYLWAARRWTAPDSTQRALLLQLFRLSVLR